MGFPNVRFYGGSAPGGNCRRQGRREADCLRPAPVRGEVYRLQCEVNDDDISSGSGKFLRIGIGHIAVCETGRKRFFPAVYAGSFFEKSPFAVYIKTVFRGNNKWKTLSGVFSTETTEFPQKDIDGGIKK